MEGKSGIPGYVWRKSIFLLIWPDLRFWIMDLSSLRFIKDPPGGVWMNLITINMFYGSSEWPGIGPRILRAGTLEELHFRLTWNPKKWRFGRWSSFSKLWWFSRFQPWIFQVPAVNHPAVWWYWKGIYSYLFCIDTVDGRNPANHLGWC